MPQARQFALREVTEMGFEAYYRAENGVWWLWHGCCGLRSDPENGTRTLIFGPSGMPEGPWLATQWGEIELRRLEQENGERSLGAWSEQT